MDASAKKGDKTVITKIALSIAVLFLLIVGAEQNKTIIEQGTTIRLLMTNPACMVDSAAVNKTKKAQKPRVRYNIPLGTLLS